MKLLKLLSSSLLNFRWWMQDFEWSVFKRTTCIVHDPRLHVYYNNGTNERYGWQWQAKKRHMRAWSIKIRSKYGQYKSSSWIYFIIKFHVFQKFVSTDTIILSSSITTNPTKSKAYPNLHLHNHNPIYNSHHNTTTATYISTTNLYTITNSSINHYNLQSLFTRCLLFIHQPSFHKFQSIPQQPW